MSINAAELLQQVADALERHRQQTLVFEEKKAQFEAASQDLHSTAAEVERLRGPVNELLGLVPQSTTRVR